MKRVALWLFLAAVVGLAPGGVWAEGVPAALVTGRTAVEDDLWPIAEGALLGLLEGDLRALEPEVLREAVTLLARVMLAQDHEASLLAFLDKRRRQLGALGPGTETFLRALALYELKRPAEALVLLEELEDQDAQGPFADQALRLRGWCLHALGDRAGAIAQLRRHARKYPAVAAADNQLDLGSLLLEDGQWEAAAAVFARLAAEHVVGEGGPSTEAGLLLALTRVEQGQWAEAAVVLEGLLAEAARAPALRAGGLMLMATVQEQLTNGTAMVAALIEVLESQAPAGTLREARRRLGLYLLGSGREDAGIAYLNQFISESPEDAASAQVQLAIAGHLLDRELHERAVEAYQRFLETYTNDVGRAVAVRGKGWALMGLKRYAEASEMFKRASELAGDPALVAECLVKAADAHFMNGQYQLAAELYERVLKSPAGAERAFALQVQLAAALDGVGRSGEATAMLVAVAQADASGVWGQEARLRLAQRDYRDGRLAEAADTFTLVIDAAGEGPYRARALMGRGVVRFDLARYEEALEDFRAVLAIDGEGPLAEEALFRVALASYWMGQGEAAVREFGLLLERFPRSAFAPDAMYWLARHAFNRQSYAEAEERFLAFQRQYPAHVKGEDALFWAVRAAALQQEYVRAVEKHLRLLLQTYPDGHRQAEALFEQGNILVELARFGDAILAFQEVVQRYPQHALAVEAWLRIGDCHFVLGGEQPARYEQAITAFQTAAASAQASLGTALQAEYKLGCCYERMGRREAAVEQFYTRVMVRYLEARERGEPILESSKMWFLRAARDAAVILESQQEWRKAVNVLNRAIGAGVEGEAVIQERIREIRATHWWLFY